MSNKALENRVERMERALSIEDGGGLGDPNELVTVFLSEEAKEALRRLWKNAPWGPEAIAKLDEPRMTPRIFAEGRTTARGRLHREELDRLMAPIHEEGQRRLAELKARLEMEARLEPAPAGEGPGSFLRVN